MRFLSIFINVIRMFSCIDCLDQLLRAKALFVCFWSDFLSLLIVFMRCDLCFCDDFMANIVSYC